MDLMEEPPLKKMTLAFEATVEIEEGQHMNVQHFDEIFSNVTHELSALKFREYDYKKIVREKTKKMKTPLSDGNPPPAVQN